MEYFSCRNRHITQTSAPPCQYLDAGQAGADSGPYTFTARVGRPSAMRSFRVTAPTRRSAFVQGRPGLFVGEGFTMPMSRRTALAVLATIAVIFSVSFPPGVSASTLHVPHPR